MRLRRTRHPREFYILPVFTSIIFSASAYRSNAVATATSNVATATTYSGISSWVTTCLDDLSLSIQLFLFRNYRFQLAVEVAVQVQLPVQLMATFTVSVSPGCICPVVVGSTVQVPLEVEDVIFIGMVPVFL